MPNPRSHVLAHQIEVLVTLMIQLECRSPHRLAGLCSHVAGHPGTATMAMVGLAAVATQDLRAVVRDVEAAGGTALTALQVVDPDGTRTAVEDAPPEAAAAGRVITAMAAGDVEAAYSVAQVAVRTLPGHALARMLGVMAGWAHDTVHERVPDG